MQTIVIGAGMVGLSTAWFLQEHGVDVTVVDKRHVAAGASWGNAGWLSPAFVVPLPEPSMLRKGISSLPKPSSPLYIPFRADPHMARFLTALTRNCTHRKWRVSMTALATLNRRAFDAYDILTDNGVRATTKPYDKFLIACETEAHRAATIEELEDVRAIGQDVSYTLLTGEQAREAEPALTDKITSALYVHGQRYLNPGDFVAALADSVRARGGKIIENTEVTVVKDLGNQVAVGELTADNVVLANGAWLNRLAKPFGVRMPVQAGRGYSFTVTNGVLPAGPTYFPARKTVYTPMGEGRGRVAGMMEFTGPDRPLDPRRIEAVIAATKPLLRDIDWTGRTDEWVGSRPCTTDGLPLVGPTKSPRVFVHGGHSMWGIALGPVTGQLLAELITKQAPAELAALHPLR